MQTATDITTTNTTIQKLISPKALAKRWEVSSATIYRWQRDGLLDPIRIGGSVRYSIHQVEEIEKG